MEISVKLYGTLSAAVPGYQPDRGLVLEMEEGSTLADLMAFLKLEKSGGETVLCAGRLVTEGEKLLPGTTLEIFQVLHGG